MKCIKCGGHVKCGKRTVWARKQNNQPVLIRLIHTICLNEKCDWQFMEDYNTKVKKLNLKIY